MENATANHKQTTKTQKGKNKSQCIEQRFAERDVIHYFKGLALNINFHMG